jgi:hypothetical protein
MKAYHSLMRTLYMCGMVYFCQPGAFRMQKCEESMWKLCSFLDHTFFAAVVSVLVYEELIHPFGVGWLVWLGQGLGSGNIHLIKCHATFGSY